MRIKLFVAVLAAVFVASSAYAIIPVALPPDAGRLTFAKIAMGMRGSPVDYELRLTFLDNKHVAIPLAANVVVQIVEAPGIRGTYARIQNTSPDRNGTGTIVCTIYVRNYQTRAAWEKMIGRYQPEPPQDLPVDVVPLEPLGY